MTGVKEAQKVKVLDWVSCICYSVQFQKDKGKDVLTLLNFGRKVNAMSPAYAAQLSLKVWKTNICAHKIDKSSLATYDMIIANFQVLNKLGCSWFFQETFLLTNISMEMVLSMPFLILNTADVQFTKKKFT